MYNYKCVAIIIVVVIIIFIVIVIVTCIVICIIMCIAISLESDPTEVQQECLQFTLTAYCIGGGVIGEITIGFVGCSGFFSPIMLNTIPSRFESRRVRISMKAKSSARSLLTTRHAVCTDAVLIYNCLYVYTCCGI